MLHYVLDVFYDVSFDLSIPQKEAPCLAQQTRGVKIKFSLEEYTIN